MFLFLIASLVFAEANHINVLPYPYQVTIHDGEWELQSDYQIQYDADNSEMKEVATICAEYLRSVTGFKLPLTTSTIKAGILFEQSENDPEAYQLSVNSNRVIITANDRAGWFYGYQTLLQLLPIEVFSDHVVKTRWIAQCCAINDFPRFSWRGLMLDTSRHFLTVEAIKSIIDAMAINKLNMLHIHLNDDQGWRTEIKKYPKLIEVGSVRKASVKKWHRDELDNTQYGPFYYTQDQLRDIVAYAKKKSVNVVPEIEMPGHTVAGLAAYPEYSCTGGPFQPYCYWGVTSEIYCAGNDAVFDFLKDILTEIFDIFDQTVYIHCGGDEVPKGRWQNCPKCQKRLQDLGLDDYTQLETWFLEQMSQWLMSKGHILIGWDEMMEGGLPNGSVVMSWRSTSAGQKAAQQGHDVVMADWTYLYLDRWQFPSDLDPYEYNNYICPTHMIWNYDPRSGLDQDAQKHILGVQTCAWAEYIYGIDDVQYKTFPRCCATAEVGWEDLDKKNWNRFVKILTEYQIPRLHRIGINAAPFAMQPEAKWLNGQISSTEYTHIQWPITGAINQKGRYQVIFVHNGGEANLKIKNVTIVFDGVVVGTDDHEGVAGDDPENNVYAFNIQTDLSFDLHMFIEADVMNDGGDNSYGHVYIYHI